jgi:hypothetical protein
MLQGCEIQSHGIQIIPEQDFFFNLLDLDPD